MTDAERQREVLITEIARVAMDGLRESEMPEAWTIRSACNSIDAARRAMRRIQLICDELTQ